MEPYDVIVNQPVVIDKTIIAGPLNDDAHYSIADIWKNSVNACTSKCKPVWIEGVQKYHDDIIEAFNKFPGPLKDQADIVTIPFENYLTKLANYSNSNSTVLSTGSTAILGVLSEVELHVNSPDGVIKEFFRVLPSLTKVYGGIISKLSNIIGKKASGSVIDAMADLERAYTNYMTEFLQEDERGLKNKENFEPITKRAEKLTKTIARVAETNKCANPDIEDASTVLTLILDHLMICYHGLSGSSEAILYEQKC